MVRTLRTPPFRPRSYPMAVAEFTKKMCPFLSGALVAKQISADTADADREALSCQGPSCALYMTIMDESGKTAVGGNCAITLTASALSHINVNVVRGVEHIAPGLTSNLVVKKG